MPGHSKLINYLEIIGFLDEHNISFDEINSPVKAEYERIETDSRLVTKNSVFVCISGFENDGHDFASKAITNGASLLIVQKKIDPDIPQIKVRNSRKVAAILAKLFFNDPTSKMKLIGITGTNGKTTVASLISKLLLSKNKKTGLIGTFGYEINGKKYRSERTTPDIIDLNKIFLKMLKAEVEFVVMEVSSHALALDRVFGLHYNAGVFTNLTHEHLDFHKNMEKYAQTKFQLFENITDNNGIAIINIDDKYGKELYRKINCLKKGISFKEGDISIRDINYSLSDSNFSLISKCSSERYRTNLTGKYNIKNITSAILVIKHFVPDISPKELNKFLHKIKVIPGRLERVRKNIFIDYAHTPDALENVLKTLTEISDKRIICVFGAGGDRDRQKRPQMLKAVLKYSNLAIITSDNPRFEEPSDIIDDITRDFDPMQPFWIQQDRSLAIQTAIDLAGEKDIVLLAGKGHETFQAIKGKNVHFSDKEEVLVYFNKGKGTDKNELSIPIDILQLEILFGQKNRSKKNRIFNFISLDSRSIKDNSIFFALKGENFDGHDYVREVLQHRNCVAVVNKNFITKGQNLIFVNDTLSALGKFAQKFKSLFNVTAIALTGSIGKTTTKEFIYNILSDSGNTLKTSANENNLIGLPKTIFNLKPNHKYAIFELGSNHFGEIAKLAEICNPDIGIITFVGPAHLEFFKDENGVYQEKSSLFRRNLKKKIFPGDDERFKEFKGITFGFNDSCSYQISKITKKESNTEFFINERKFMIPTPFKHFCLNATIAVALAKEVGIREKKIKANLLKSLQISQRMEIRKLKNHTLLIDCYNANPDSMLAAIDFWKNFEVDKNHIAILGDMLELGNLTEKLHKKIWNSLKNIQNKYVISVGEFARFYQADIHFKDVEKLINSTILSSFSKNSVILIKASHGIHLEKIIKRI